MKQKLAGMMTASSIAILSLTTLTASVYMLSPVPALASPGNSGGHGGGNGGGNDAGQSSGGASSHADGGSSANSNTGSSHSGNAGQGSIHSELKGLNAAHASLTALANAAPNSQVGRIATYRTAALATEAQAKSLDAALKAYNAYLGTYTGPTAADLQSQITAANTANAALQSQINALDPMSSTFTTDKAALEAQMTDTASLTTQLQQAQTYEANLATLQQQVTTDQTAYDTNLAAEQTALNTAANGRTLSAPALAELRRELGL